MTEPRAGSFGDRHFISEVIPWPKWYNPVRLHFALNYRSPIRYEQDMQTELLPTKS